MAEIETNIGTTETTAEAAVDTQETADTATESEVIAKLRAEMSKQKAALDKASKEAADYKKQLRAKQSAEESAAAEAEEQQNLMKQRLEQLERERAVAITSKRAFKFLQDESLAGEVATGLYHAEDADAVLDAIEKAWTAREKALRLEFGRVPAPGVGSTEGPTITKAQLDAMGYRERLDFAQKNPEEYRRLMGR